MNFKSELLNINQKIANKGIKLRIEQRGSRLGLRGPLPCQENPEKTKDMFKALYIYTKASMIY